jgi:hypothetical protein
VRRLAVALAVLALVASLAPAVAVAGSQQEAGNTTTTPTASPTPVTTPTDTPTPSVSPTTTTTPTASPTPVTTPTDTPTPSVSPTTTATPTPEPTSSTADQNDGPGIDELQRGGQPVAKDAQSLRLTDDRFWWLIAWPAGTSGAPTNDKWKYVGDEEMRTVQKNAVYLRTFALESGGETVKIAYWEPKTKTVQRGNTTETVRYAANVSVQEVDLTYQRGRPTLEIPLKQHPEPTQVTMWLASDPDTRWVFEHHSIATTQSAGIDSEGDYLRSIIMDFGWIVVVGLLGGGLSIRAAMRRAGIGPQWGYLPWVIGWGLSTGLALLIDYSAIANFVVANPWAIAVWVVVLGLLIMLETFQQNVRKVRFVQPKVEDATSPRGESVLGRIGEKEVTKRVVKLPDGGHAVVGRGPRRFLARLVGAPALFENYDERAAKVEVEEGGVDEKIYIDPDADDILEIEPEGFDWAWKRKTLMTEADGEAVLDEDGERLYETAWNYDRIAISLFATAGVGVATALAFTPLVGYLAGAATLGLSMLSPKRTAYARAEFAPAHVESVHTSMVAMRQGLEDAKTFEQMEQKLGEADVQPIKQAMNLMQAYSVGAGEELHDLYGEYQDTEPDAEEVPADD